MIKKSAAILAGGKSSRMNYENKAFLKYENKYFIERIIEALVDYDEIIIIANNPEEYKGLGCNIFKDIYPDQGPLSGIHSALNNIKNEYCLVVACDMPFINRDVVKYLGSIKEEYEILIPKVEERLQPLCAIYKKSCEKFIEKELKKNNNKLIKVCLGFNIKVVKNFPIIEKIHKKDIKNFYNINTLDEYKNLVGKIEK